MFIVFLRLSDNRAAAPRLMEGHKAWIARGVADGVFLLVGTLQPAAGGAILAHGATRAELEARLAEDPFVAEDVARPEVHEVSPVRGDPRLGFLFS